MKALHRVITLTVIMGAAASMLAASPRGVDARIAGRLARFIAAHREYSHIQFQVEDAIVSLTGTVQLETQRRALASDVKALPEVEGIRTNVLLEPPAVSDDVLYPRVMQRLAGLHMPQLQVSVHEGLVTIGGSVRDERAREAVVTMAQSTEGVKEVISQLQVEEPR